MKSKILISVKFDSFKIFINEVLHLSLKLKGLIGVHSWRDSDKGRFYIEYIYKGNEVLTEYDSEEKWLELLDQINKKDLYL